MSHASTAPLHHTTITKAVPVGEQYDLRDGTVRGLTLRINRDGSRKWTLRYRPHARQQRRLHLGAWPKMSLSDARAAARDALQEIAEGKDPVLMKRQRRTADTVNDLIERYITEYAEPRKRSWRNDARMLRKKVAPAWGNRLAQDIQRRDVRELVEPIARRGEPYAANRLKSVISKLFSWATSQELVAINPAIGVARPGVETSRDRVLSDDEIRTLWKALDGVGAPMRAFYRLRLLLAQRGGETADLRWADVDLENGWWTIPAERAKNGKAHRVPLSAPALVLLRGLRAEARDGATFALEGSRSKRDQAAALIGPDGRPILPNFRGHDLRRTAATLMGRLGVPRDAIGALLNHSERGVTAIYDRASRDTEKRAALDKLAGELDRILTHEPARVVPMRRGRK